MDFINEILWNFGLTREINVDISSTLSETVVAKKTQEKEPYFEVDRLSGIIMASTEKRDIHLITFTRKNEKTIFLALEGKKPFEAFRNDEEAELRYAIVRKACYDYCPPDFSYKQCLRMDFFGYWLKEVKSNYSGKVYPINAMLMEVL